MKIPYSTRSRFFAPLERALPAGDAPLRRTVTVALGPRGYDGDVQVVIRRDDSRFFETDWESRQPTRFPVRIRAAASVLQRNGYEGRFRVSHRDGGVIVEPM